MKHQIYHFPNSSKQRSSFEDLKMYCEVLDDEAQIAITGAGIKYIFDQQGNLLNQVPIDGDNDALEVSGIVGAYMDMSGSMGNLVPPTTYPQSGSSFTGSGIDSGVFQFLARNTNVEWVYCYKEGEEGGYIGTSNQEHAVGLPAAKKFKSYGYDSVMHNHAQDYSGPGSTPSKVINYNSHPSEEDKQRLIDYDFTHSSIYNEFDDGVHPYFYYTESQEEIADRYKWDI